MKKRGKNGKQVRKIEAIKVKEAGKKWGKGEKRTK